MAAEPTEKPKWQPWPGGVALAFGISVCLKAYNKPPAPPAAPPPAPAVRPAATHNFAVLPGPQPTTLFPGAPPDRWTAKFASSSPFSRPEQVPVRPPDAPGPAKAPVPSPGPSVPEHVVLAAVPAPSPPSRVEGPPPEVTVEIRTAAYVDERLFLLRALEALYSGWPDGQGGPGSIGPAIDALRHEALRHQKYILERGIDERIAALYGDLVGLLDAFADALAKADRIERDGAALADRQRAEAAGRAGMAGGVAAGRAYRNGAGGGEALATWAGVTIVGTLVDELARRPARSEARKAAEEANLREYTRRASEVFASAEAAATALAARHGWARAEAGFDSTPERDRRVLAILERGDSAGILRFLDEMRDRRPRDPFLRSIAAMARWEGLRDRATPEALARGVEECLAAARLVPEGAFYDPYRASFVAQAGYHATCAAGLEIGGKGCAAGPAPGGPRALAIWRAYLAIDDRDPTGEAREQLALALAVTGRFEEAARAAGQVADLRGPDPDFSYSYACLLSLAGGDTAKSLRWLEHAYRDCHYPDILVARADPDLARLRADQAAGFAELTRVKFRWAIDWGLFNNDDICLTNDSPFPLTGVELEVNVESPGVAPWSSTLKADRIEPGATRRWKVWVAARGKGADGKATLKCDQQ